MPRYKVTKESMQWVYYI